MTFSGESEEELSESSFWGASLECYLSDFSGASIEEYLSDFLKSKPGGANYVTFEEES